MHDRDDPLRRGARLFDAGEFFAAHEAWEERWRVTGDLDERRLLQGLIQVAAGFHKLLVMRNPPSAVRLLERGLARLDACPDLADGIDLAGFRAATRRCARAITGGDLDRAAIPALLRR